jgi:UDP-N-acetyl-D-glucosamine/UDP-N-acetyl-D-galactosamine dehydrogenase
MKKIKIGVIGLGYVGLPVSVVFSNKYEVIGYDINNDRINKLNNNLDDTMEISSETLKKAINGNLTISSNIDDILDCNFYIITVPTPIDNNNEPDLSALLNATKSVGKIISKGDIIVYESTVFPGCTEEECVPILESESNLKYNQDFYCGYSPERINPGDKTHTIEKIVKITSGSTKQVAKKIDEIYSSVIEAGTCLVSSIKVAEAAKVIENSQRDVNIAFVNELAKIFSTLNIDSNEVLDAASTKWNFLDFRPGLVGGHCIGVDPYYLAYKAKNEGHTAEIILSGRKVNNSMGKFIVDEVVKAIESEYKATGELQFLIMGATFKENCPDYRNSKVLDIFEELKKLNFNFDVFDPWIDKDSFFQEHKIKIHNKILNKKYDAIIVAVAHDEFKLIDIKSLKSRSSSVIYDVKGILDKRLITKRL